MSFYAMITLKYWLQFTDHFVENISVILAKTRTRMNFVKGNYEIYIVIGVGKRQHLNNSSEMNFKYRAKAKR